MDLQQIFQDAVARRNSGDLAGAEEGFRSIVAQSESPTALFHLAALLEHMARHDEAEAFYRRLAALRPDAAGAQAALGHHLRLTRRLEEAETVYRRVLDLDAAHPTAKVDLALSLLGQGRLGEGFSTYEERPARLAFLGQKLSFPEWRGEPLAGKRLFVWREQGFGDQIMAARFLPKLGAGAVTYAGPAALERLFRQLGVDYLVSEAMTEVQRHDFWTLPFSIPARLGVDVVDLPSEPYFRGQAKPSTGRIGLAWRGQAKNPNDRHRSLPEDQARRLLAIPGVVSLHPEDTGAADFQETADLIAGLDLVVSVDTSIAHLAGAMGKPVWVMVAAYALDWHWLRGEDRSPWYPSARVIRQPRPGAWDAVVDQVSAGIAAL